MTTVTLRFDDDMKKELDKMVDDMGMNITTFFMIYAKRALRDRKIPFEVTAPEDPFFSDSNMKRLQESEQQFRDGKVVVVCVADNYGDIESICA
jgi:DNA-damage-inducible protein J